MKYIKKSEEPECLANWKSLANENWTPTYNDDFRGKIKTDVHDSLLHEQGYICCYCGMRVTRDTSHFEHLKPRSAYPELALDYRNLLISCQTKRTQSEHCAYKKDDWYDEHLMISPLQSNCAEFFRYSEAGEILPADEPDKQAAATTISKLELNISKLTANRRKAIEDILEVIDHLSDEDIKKLIQGFNQPNDKGEYEEFCVAIIYILNQTLLYRLGII